MTSSAGISGQATDRVSVKRFTQGLGTMPAVDLELVHGEHPDFAHHCTGII